MPISPRPPSGTKTSSSSRFICSQPPGPSGLGVPEFEGWGSKGRRHRSVPGRQRCAAAGVRCGRAPRRCRCARLKANAASPAHRCRRRVRARARGSPRRHRPPRRAAPRARRRSRAKNIGQRLEERGRADLRAQVAKARRRIGRALRRGRDVDAEADHRGEAAGDAMCLEQAVPPAWPPSRIRSFGHFRDRRSRRCPRANPTASCRASPATKPSCGASARSQGSISKRLA